MRNDKENIIVSKTFNFALQIIDYSEELRSRHKYEMTSQLFKSGTSMMKPTIGNFAVFQNIIRTHPIPSSKSWNPLLK